MIRQLIKTVRAHNAMQATVEEGLCEISERIQRKTCAMKDKLQNGGGEALIGILTKQ